MIDQLYKVRNEQYLFLISKKDERNADFLFREIKGVSYNTQESLEAWQKISHTVSNEALNEKKIFQSKGLVSDAIEEDL